MPSISLSMVYYKVVELGIEGKNNIYILGYVVMYQYIFMKVLYIFHERIISLSHIQHWV